MDSVQDPEIDCIKTLLSRINVYSKGSEVNPHKYVLLLAIAALLESNKEHPNRFTFQELEPVFAVLFDYYFPHWPANRKLLEYPFYYLQNEKCWHLQIKPGSAAAYRNYQKTRLTRKRLVETVAYAYLDEPIFNGLHNPAGRHLVEQQLVAMVSNASVQNEGNGTQIHEAEGEYTTNAEITSLFEHEARAINDIQASIAGFGKLLSNVEIYDSQSNSYYEYDVILAAHSGLYVVELKHWSGRVRVAPHNWVIDDHHYRRDPHLTNGFKCKLLKGLYERSFPTFPGVWVESVVVLTNPAATVEHADSPAQAAAGAGHNLTFASLTDFFSYLRKREASPAQRVLTDGQIDALLRFLGGLATPPRSNLYTVPGYETVQYLFQGLGRIELLARPLDGRTRGLKRFRIFRLPTTGTPEERERAKRQAMNTLDAVERIGDHPNIHRVLALRNDEGDIIEGSEWSDAGTLKDLLERREHLPLDKALAVCRGLALALAAAHSAGIIHRTVKPEHVLMANGIPKLTDFDLSYQLDRRPGEVTVLPDAATLKDDGYTAPELLAGEDIDESTDLFSLGAIAYQLLTGVRPFASARALIAQGGKLGEGEVQRLAEGKVPAQASAALRRVLVADRAQRLKDAQRLVEAFAPLEEGAAPAVANAQLEPGATYDIYEIVRLLGEGAEGQTYLAKAIREEQVALKLFNREVPRETIFRQQSLAEAVAGKNTVRPKGMLGLWNRDRYFLVLEYVAGETLREHIRRGERPDVETFRRVALGLLDALQLFHGHQGEDGAPECLVHGDVKPDNILLASAGEPKLTDLSVAGPPRVDEFAGTVGYVPPDRIRGTEMQFAPDGDLFALGVTLWEWLFGAKPYAKPAVGEHAVAPELPSPAFPNGWRAWLERAVATTEKERFTSVEEMRRAFLDASVVREEAAVSHSAEAPTSVTPIATAHGTITDQPKQTATSLAVTHANGFVAYLNTLSSASAGNGNSTDEENRCSPFFPRVYVHNPLVEIVLEELVNRRHHVILTGNAGDGKTTIASDIYEKLMGYRPPADARIFIPSAQLVIVKDMSELPAEERARIIEEAAASSGPVHLIVTNTGTLLGSAERLPRRAPGRQAVHSKLLKALEADDMVPVLDGHFLLLNIGRVDSIATACAVLQRMLERDNWLACTPCPLGERCPILANVRLLWESKDTVLRRVELAYRRLYEYGTRLTLRQMIGHLAYALTAGRDCAQIGKLSETQLGECLHGSLFHNRFFGDDGGQLQPEADQLQPVRHLRAAEFGVELDPELERGLWQGDGAGGWLSPQALALLRDLQQRAQEANARLRWQARQEARRLLYFYGTMKEDEGGYPTVFLRSPTLLDYLRITRGEGSIPSLWESVNRRRVLQVLQEHFAALRLPEGKWQATDRLYITLKPRAAGANTQVVLASYATEDFRIVATPVHRALPDSGRSLRLAHNTGPTMPLDLPFLDYVTRRSKGEIAAQLSAFYADRLQRFGAQLLGKPDNGGVDGHCLQLLRIGAGGRVRPVQILFSSGHMEVLR